MSVMPESCTVQWTLWFPLVPEHSIPVRSSLVGDGVVVLVAAPCVAGVVAPPLSDENRFPFSGSINEIGSDIQRIKDMGVDHIVSANRKRRR
jgi:hypothetical protein